MLNVLRQREKLVRRVLVGVLFLVCVSMVVTLIPGLTGDAGDTINNPVAAEVDGERVTELEVRQALQSAASRNNIPAQLLPFYAKNLLNQIILEKASLKEAERLGLRVEEGEMREQLKKDETLFPGGNFIGQDRYQDIVAQNTGMNVRAFEQRMRDSMLMFKLRNVVTDSVSVSPDEVHREFLKQNEKVTLDYVALYPIDLRKDISTPDNALQEYFNKNKARYPSPEKRSAKVLWIERNKIRSAVSISDAEIRRYYDEHAESYRKPERVTVQHILLKADPKNPSDLAEAKKKAEDVLKKLKAGGDFAALAKQFSGDPSNAQNGGLLPNIERKQMVPEFEKVAFSLAPGQLSDLVQTTYGYHIVKGVSHEQPHMETYEQNKASIQLILTEEKTVQVLREQADRAAQALSSTPAEIDSIAKQYQAQVLTFTTLDKDSDLPPFGKPATLIQSIFAAEKNKAGQPSEAGDGFGVPVVTDIMPGHPSEFADVKEKVKSDYVDEQANAKAVSKAQELAKLIDQPGKDIKIIAKTLGLTAKTSPSVGREEQVPSLTSMKDLGSKPFDLPVGGSAGPIAISGGTQIVYQVVSKQLPDDAQFATKKAEIEAKLRGEKQDAAFQVFQDALEKKLTDSGKLKLHQDVISKFTLTPTMGQ